MTRAALRRVATPACEALEARKLLAHASAAAEARFQAMAAVQHLRADVNRLAADVRTMQAHSHVSASQYMAVLSDIETDSDVGGIPSGTETLGAATFDIVYKVDYAVIEAGFDAQGWADKQAALTKDFAAIGSPLTPSQTDQLMTDIEAMAQSAGVTNAQNQKYWTDVTTVDNDLQANPALVLADPPFYSFQNQYTGFVKVQRGGLHGLKFGPGGSALPTLSPDGGTAWSVALA